MPSSLLLSSLFDSFLSSANVQHLAMALLHNLWQGAVVALVLVGLLRLIPARKANLRYVACLSAMTLVLVCGLATWGWLNIRAANLASNVTALEKVTALSQSASTAPSNWLNWPTLLVVLWLVGVAFTLARLAVSFCQVQQLKQDSRVASSDIQNLVQSVASRCGLKNPLRALVNENLSSAAVIGVLKPIVFLPASMVTGLTESQLEAVIAHEIAHIRRFDPIVNFCQMLIEALLFFNPAVAWIGRQIRMEREACCDAVGVSATGDQSVYLDTLALWAERMQGSAAPVGALAFADRQKSTLVDRVRRVLFPDFVPATRFSPMSTVFLFAIGLTLLATLWQGTMVAVALADKLLPHEQIVQALEDTRDEYDGAPAPLGKETVATSGPMTVKIKLETEDGQPTTSRVRIHYQTHSQKNGNTSSLQATAGSIKAGDTEASFVIKEGWGDVLVSSDDYVPFAIRDVRPDPKGDGNVANVVVPLRRGYPGQLKVVTAEGDPIANATISLNKVLIYKTESKISANSKSTSTHYVGSGTEELRTDAEGIAIIAHATELPRFKVRVTASGFESFAESPFGIAADEPHKVVLKRALPIVGVVTDENGAPLKDVSLHSFSSFKKTPNGTHYNGVGGFLIAKEFSETLAVTSEKGEFSIDTLNSDWTYNLIADAGDRGLTTFFGARPGDEPVTISINGPVNISGVVSGNLERLRKGDEYVLTYGLCLTGPDGNSKCDSSGRLKLDVVDGKAKFELKNVLPGVYRIRGNEIKVTESMDDVAIVVPSEAEDANRTVARNVRLKFKSGAGVAAFRGRISVFSRQEHSDVHFGRPVDVVDGVAEFEVNAPTKLNVELMDAPGFLFDDGLRKTNLMVDVGEGDLEENVEVFPAGSVVGQIKVAERREGAWLGVFGYMDSRCAGGVRTSSVSDECDADGKFHLANVPYGATFRLKARHGAFCQLIESIDVSEQTPLVEKQITLEDGPVLRGTIIDSEGKPFAQQPISLRLLLGDKDNHFEIGSVLTNRDGEFDFGPVNSKLGTHFVEIRTERTHAQTFVAVEEFDSPLNITLAPGLIIEGRLIDDETGEPIAGAEVYAMPSKFRLDAIHGYEAEGKTDENGIFEFTNLNDEEYQLNTRVLRGRVVNRDDVPAGKRNVRLRVTTSPNSPTSEF